MTVGNAQHLKVDDLCIEVPLEFQRHLPQLVNTYLQSGCKSGWILQLDNLSNIPCQPQL